MNEPKSFGGELMKAAQMKTVFVTVTDKDGVILDRVEMMWNPKSFPAHTLEIVPMPQGKELVATHPAQVTLNLGK